jgi:formamidopyrimidine-DNA glycosylase
MPELPEVETVASQLDPLIAGRAVRSLRILDSLLGTLPVGRVRGSRVARVFRLGKQVVLELERRTRTVPRLWLAVHLRMTGRLLWRPGDNPVGAADRPHLRARLALDGGTVDFVDPRRFGVIHLADDLQLLEPAGTDPTGSSFTRGLLRRLLAGSGQEIKPWLLRQDRITGLGNIYASEILARSRLHPARRAGSLDTAEVRRLHAATVAILKQAIRHCGTTFSDFQDSRGDSGGFQRFLKVYGHEGDPCRRCRAPVKRMVQQGRSTFFCPACQPATAAAEQATT